MTSLNKKWLQQAIDYLSNRMASTKDSENFILRTKKSANLTISFNILTKLWGDHPEYCHSPKLWKEIESEFYQDLAPKILLKMQTNSNTPEDVRLWEKIQSVVPSDKLKKIELSIKLLFGNSKTPEFIEPKSDLFLKLKPKLNTSTQQKSSKKLSPKISNRLSELNKNPNYKSITIAVLSSAAAIILLFILLFSGPTNNSTDIITEKPIDKIQPKNPVIKILPKENDSTIPDEPKINADDMKPDNIKNDNNKTDDKTPEIVEKPEIETPENKEPVKPEEIKEPKKETEPTKPEVVEKPVEKPDKPDDVIKEPKKEYKKPDETKKTEPKADLVLSFDNEYEDLNIENFDSNLPFAIGKRLYFSSDPEETMNFTLPTKTQGFSVKKGKRNTLLVDFNNDGFFEKQLYKTSEFELNLQYDGPKKKNRYRIIFIQNELSKQWILRPNGSQQTKKQLFDLTKIQLIDANLNGKYNDIGVDVIVFKSTNSIQLLSESNFIGEKWLKIKPSENGHIIEITEIAPKNIGKLEIKTNYSNKALKLKWLNLYGNNAVIKIKNDDSSEIKLPEGKYTILNGLVGTKNQHMEFKGCITFFINIKKDATAEIILGGELKLEFMVFTSNLQNQSITNYGVKLIGNCKENYNKLSYKNQSKPIAPEEVIIKSKDNVDYLLESSFRYQPGYKGSFFNLPKFRVPGIYTITMREKEFSKFLSGKITESQPFDIPVYR